MYNVGIVGAGKVGTSLGLYFFDKGELSLRGYYSRSIESSNYAAQKTKAKSFDSLDDLVEECQIIIVTTPDDEISKVWSQIKKFNIRNKIICHCSGSLSSSVFFDCTTKEAHCCSFHPMLAVSSKESSYKALGGAFFTLEGSPKAVELISRQLILYQNPYKIISSSDKRKYHLASVCISNLVIGLGSISVRLLKEYGFKEEEALEALSTLGMRNLESFFQKGALATLTGPLERGDLGTIQGHLDAISGSEWKVERQAYQAISQVLLEIAKEKHPERDYSNLDRKWKKGEADKK